ncbi:MAG: cysteine desulfurase NifS [Verrucomicrobia bacterium]|jgi:cysteine desulfurase|nr:cysteine desulfurase NifS [Verrucomicrobiota bacterium]
MQTVYLDSNATTRVAPEVTEAMLPFFSELWGNPSSMHFFGGQVAKHIDQAREQVAALIGAEPSEILFTSCGTESNNTAICGTAEAQGTDWPIITTRVEHPAVLQPCRRFKEHGYREFEISVDGNGEPDLDAFKKALGDGPAIVSVMWANNETGVISPIDEIAALVEEAGGVMHTDAVQAVGKLPVDVSTIPVDMLSLSGHKLHAPKGVGALYVRKGTKLKPFMLGGHQENGRRAGTENVPYIVGLGKACELARMAVAKNEALVANLRDKLESGILATCPDTRVNGANAKRLPNTSSISFEFIEGEAILYHLSDLGIAASSGSACASGSLEPSHVIRAMGIPFTAAHGTIRFSLSRYTTEDDVAYVLAHMPDIVERLRRLSPFI